MKSLVTSYLFILAISISAQTFVDIDAVGGSNDGTSWTDAYTNLNTAIDSSSFGDELWVAEGTYIPDRFPRDSMGSPTMNERDYTFHLMDGVALYGGFNGTETSISERNIDSFPVFLSGQIDSTAGLYAYHVTLSVNDTATTLLSGFIITKGASFFPDPPPPITVEGVSIARLNGSGMYNINSNPSLDRVVFFENFTFLGQGGGMYNDASSPNLIEVKFIENLGTEGAGMYNSNGSAPTLINVKFKANDGFKGIGMYNNASSPMLTSCFFEVNKLDVLPNDDNVLIEGAGMYNGDGSAPNLTLVTFYNNVAEDYGGGVFNSASSPVLLNVRFHYNGAFEGGGMYNNNSSPVINYGDFLFNGASDGGGMYNVNSTPTLDNSQFRKNNAVNGAGIFNDASSPEINNSNFKNNRASQNGGGVYNENSSAAEMIDVLFYGNRSNDQGGGMYNRISSPVLENVVFDHNQAVNGGGMANFNASPTISNCSFKDNWVTNWGGGMNNDSTSAPILTDVQFSNNRTTVHPTIYYPSQYEIGRGGGMNNDNGSCPSLTRVSFDHNIGNYGGGMSIDNGCTPILNNVIFNDNIARMGGGIYNLFSSLSIKNTSFSNNVAGPFDKWPACTFYSISPDFYRFQGGGMYIEGDDSITLTNVIFSNNVARRDSLNTTSNDPGIILGFGGGIYNNNSRTASPGNNLTLINVTFNENFAECIVGCDGIGHDVYNDSDFPIAMHNCVVMAGLIPGIHVFSVGNPMGSGLNNLTLILGDEFTDHSHPIGADNKWGTSDDGLTPSFGSPIINAGDSSVNNTAFDITGQDRIIGDTIDVGAYEFTVCNDTTEYIAGSWTNGLPTPRKNVVFKDDYNTLVPGNGSILACKCIVDSGFTLTIGDGTALHVYFNGINIEGSIIVEDGGSIVNGIWQ